MVGVHLSPFGFTKLSLFIHTVLLEIELIKTCFLEAAKLGLYFMSQLYGKRRVIFHMACY